MFSLVFSILLLKIVNVDPENVTEEVHLVDCPTGYSTKGEYILEGTYATCRCQKLNDSQTGQVAWYLFTNPTLVKVSPSSMADDYSVIEINTERQDLNTTLIYFCLIEDGNYTSDPIFYLPKIAYGPDPNSLLMNPEVNSNWTFDLCPGKAKKVSVVCDIDSGKVSPKPKLQFHYIFSDNVQECVILSNESTVVDNLYRFTRTFDVEAPGKYSITCNLINEAFPNIKQAVHHYIYVREPPGSMPVFTISETGKNYAMGNGNTASVIGNSHVTVTCSVNGGTPEVISVTVACDKNQNTKTGTTASLEFDVTQTVSIVCTCEANHVSGCYNFKSVIQIVAIYQATIINFTANGLSDTLIVDSGSEVSFACYATGNSTPIMSLLRSDKTTLKEIQGLQISAGFKNVQCDFTNRYYCVAKNGFETSIDLPQRSIDVYVRCLTRLRYPINQNMVIDVKVGTVATVAFQVMGYPSPNSFLLTKPKSNLDIAVNQSKYSVSYQAEQNEMPTPYGTVTLIINAITKDDLIAYKLMISNGGQVTFSFTLVQATTNDTLYIAIGVSAGVLLIIIIAVIIAICYCRNKRKAKTDTNAHLYDTPKVENCAQDYYPYDVFRKDSADGSASGSYITVLGNVYDTLSVGSNPVMH